MNEFDFAQTMFNTEPWYIKYFWHIMALAISPLFGFFFTQKIKKMWKLHNAIIINMAGASTAIFAYLCWFVATKIQIEAALIAVTMYVFQPVGVWIWFKIARRMNIKTGNCLHITDETSPTDLTTLAGGDKTQPKEDKKK